jgi:hypothetical protein
MWPIFIENVQNSGPVFTSAKQTDATAIPPNPMDTAMYSIFEQHVAPRIDNNSSPNTDGQRHERDNGLSLDSDVERGE